MRLVCPNCGAQYEVPDDAIPPQGRDVQCSNCAHTWLERPGMIADEGDRGDSIDSVYADAEDTWDAAAGLVDEPPATTAAPDGAASLAASPPMPDDAADVEITTAAPEPPAPVAAAKTPVRQSLAPAVAEILREEAAREEASRRAETQATAQMQPDLGLDRQSDRPIDREDQLAEEARRRMARMKGEPAPAMSAPVTNTSGARSDLLPDIEEINSSLRSSADRATSAQNPVPQEIAEARDKRGFRFGFTLILLLFAALALIYALAPQIARAVPQAEPALTSYVETVDKGRLWLDLQLQSLMSGTVDAVVPASDEPGAAASVADPAADPASATETPTPAPTETAPETAPATEPETAPASN